jgi:hypothetical protein
LLCFHFFIFTLFKTWSWEALITMNVLQTEIKGRQFKYMVNFTIICSYVCYLITRMILTIIFTSQTFKMNTVKSLQKFPHKGFSGMWVWIIYYDRFQRNIYPRCRMRWDRYFRRYWLESSSVHVYPICCTDFGTISLLYLCMNNFIVISMYERLCFVVLSWY